MPARRLEPAVVVGEVDVARRGIRLPAAQDVASGRRVVVPAVGRVAGHAGVGGRVDPVALETVTVGVGHVPAGRLESAGTVGQVDVARRRVYVPTAHRIAVRSDPIVEGAPRGVGSGRQPRGNLRATLDEIEAGLVGMPAVSDRG